MSRGVTRRVPRRVTGSFNQFLAKSNFVGRSPAGEEKFEPAPVRDASRSILLGEEGEDGSFNVLDQRPSIFLVTRRVSLGRIRPGEARIRGYHDRKSDSPL